MATKGGFSTAPRTNDLLLYIFAVEIGLSDKSNKTIESFQLHKYKSVAYEIKEAIIAGEPHQEVFTRPIAIDPSDNCRASVKLRRSWPRGSESVEIPLNLHEIHCVPNEQGERFFRFEVKEIVLVISAHREFSAITNRIMPQTDSQFRILVIGNSGVGKSSLINKVFGITDAKVSDTTRGEADIEHGFTSRDNRFVIHDTLGFEAGDEENVQIVQKFIDQRRAKPRSDSLHAVWLCLEIPYAGGRLFEKGTENFLRNRKDTLGDIPLVVALTKVDLLDGQMLVDLPKGRTVEDFKAENMRERFIEPLLKAGGKDLKYVTVSTGDNYADDLYQLLEATSGKS